MLLSDHYKRLLEKFQDAFSEVNRKLQSVFKIGVESSIRIRRRQFFMGGCLALGISLFVYAVMNVLRNQGPVPKQEAASKPVTTNISTATKQVDMSEVRWNNLDGAINTLRQQVAEIAEAVYGEGYKVKGNSPQADPLKEGPELQQLSNVEEENERDGPAPNDELQNNLQTSLREIKERLSTLETQSDQQPPSPFMEQPNSFNAPQNGDEQNMGSIHNNSRAKRESW